MSLKYDHIKGWIVVDDEPKIEMITEDCDTRECGKSCECSNNHKWTYGDGD